MRYIWGVLAGQLSLLGHEAPSFDDGFAGVQRTTLTDGAWVDYAPGWLAGHADVFDVLVRDTAWQTGQEQMYDRLVETPRVFAAVTEQSPGHPVLAPIARALSRHYGQAFVRTSLALYRTGRDSVAFHGDRIARTLPDALVATVSVGAPRRFLLRPRDGGRSIGFDLGWGDLIVMGGSCQRTWQHSIPKVAHANPRIAIMFRPHWGDDY